MNYDNLPLGTQKCSFKIGSWVNGKNSIDLGIRKSSGQAEEENFYSDQVDLVKLDVSYHEKYYDCCPNEAYVHLLVDLEFKQKQKYKDGKLHVAAVSEWLFFSWNSLTFRISIKGNLTNVTTARALW